MTLSLFRYTSDISRFVKVSFQYIRKKNSVKLEVECKKNGKTWYDQERPRNNSKQVGKRKSPL